jgi:hypothetical protein
MEIKDFQKDVHKIAIEEKRVLTCVYCGKEYPQDTPAWGSNVLTQHIKICEKHPMREAERKIARLRNALIGMVGVEERSQLEEMKSVLRVISGADSDRIASINAIDVLLETEI